MSMVNVIASSLANSAEFSLASSVHRLSLGMLVRNGEGVLVTPGRGMSPPVPLGELGKSVIIFHLSISGPVVPSNSKLFPKGSQ